jgi:hypothetical protein
MWLGSYQKLQLGQLIGVLRGPTFVSSADRKKSELVEDASLLFANAAAGKLENSEMQNRINAWLPKLFRLPLADQATSASEPDIKVSDVGDAEPMAGRRNAACKSAQRRNKGHAYG